MKKGLTEIAVILDESGSMNEIKSDTIGGFNSFLKVNRDLPGEAKLTLVKFSTNYNIVYNGINIKEASDLNQSTYYPSGMTSLLDAVGKAIDEIGGRLSKTTEEERPEKVLMVIITDGEENSSREYSLESIKEKITHQKDKYNWEFVFLGADQDAWSNGGSMGISSSASFNKMDIGKTMMSTTLYSANYRGFGGKSASMDLYNLSSEDLKKELDDITKGGSK